MEIYISKEDQTLKISGRSRSFSANEETNSSLYTKQYPNKFILKGRADYKVALKSPKVIEDESYKLEQERKIREAKEQETARLAGIAERAKIQVEKEQEAKRLNDIKLKEEAKRIEEEKLQAEKATKSRSKRNTKKFNQTQKTPEVNVIEED